MTSGFFNSPNARARPSLRYSFRHLVDDRLAILIAEGVYRRGGGQNTWLYYKDTGELELRANSETIATFADPEDVFADPATESEITDFDEWTTIKRPALPGRIDRDMVDVIAVTDDGLHVLEGDERTKTPIGELVDSGEQLDDRSASDRADDPLAGL